MRNPALRRIADARVALVTFGVVEVASLPLLAFWGRRWWFWADDWDFLAARTGGNLGDLFRAHYQHWTTLPVVAYRLLWLAFGLRTYLPYQLLVIVAHLVAAALLRVVMRRAGVHGWVATLAAGVFVFFGSGAENILIAFQITFVGSLVFGLVQLLLADHDGPIDRRDWFGLLAGLAGLMCSGVAITMTIIVGLAMLLRRGPRVALLHTAPLAAAYAIWSGLRPKSLGASVYRSQSLLQVAKFVVIGFEAAFGRLAQVPGLGLALVALLIVGSVGAYRARGASALRSRLAVPAALLVGAVIFLLMTGVFRSGQPGPITNAIGVGPERARESRYVYIVAALALPALALAAEAVIRRWRLLAVPVVVLFLAGVPGNIRQLERYTNQSIVDRRRFRTAVLEAPRLPLARVLPAALPPAPPSNFEGLTLGWLVRSLPSGRIPKPGYVSGTYIANQTLRLAFRDDIKFPQTANCRRLHRPTVMEFRLLQRVTLKSGEATISYLPAAGAPSDDAPFVPTTLVAVADKVRLRITPISADAPVVCRQVGVG